VIVLKLFTPIYLSLNASPAIYYLCDLRQAATSLCLSLFITRNIKVSPFHRQENPGTEGLGMQLGYVSGTEYT
jgi:hypothetical protein